ncbi:MAG: hypothetical protein JNL08_02190 [Planctomycetes bacterium]|nr:hypothetical protein [Planctomycetota bacterium]
MTETGPSTLRLLLVPTLVTLLVSVARLMAEVQGRVTNLSGGRGALLGITWLVFVFGGWFGWRLARLGSAPRVRRAWLWSLLSLVAIVGTAAWRFAQVDLQDRSETAFAALRGHVLVIAAVTTAAGLLQFVVWPRLAAVLLGYGLLARATVLALTWLAKQQGWDTHYTKFGPAGIERDLPATMLSATIAQIGFWVPFTIVGGMVVGCLVGGRRRAP